MQHHRVGPYRRPAWPSHSLALGNLPARFCISAQDTSLHLCSARRNIVSVRVMNGFTCLIDFDRKKFDVKVVVGRVVERRGPVLPSHVSNRGGDLNITSDCRSRLGNQLSSSAPVIATVFTLLPGSTSIEQVDAQCSCSTTQCRVERWTINCKTTWQQMAVAQPSL